jgi:hypothetical protein
MRKTCLRSINFLETSFCVSSQQQAPRILTASEMSSFRYPTAADKSPSFKDSCEIGHRQELGDTKTEPAVLNPGDFAPTYFAGSMSDLCNIHCSKQWRANQVYNKHPSAIDDAVDMPRRCNSCTERLHEDVRDKRGERSQLQIVVRPQRLLRQKEKTQSR